MFIKNIKFFFSFIVSIYLFNRISKDIYLNFTDLEFLTNKISLLLITIFLFIPIFYLLTIKLIYLLNHKKKIDFGTSFKATVIAYNYNLFLPAKSGDFFRYKFLDLKTSFKSFFSINIIEKSISLYILIFLIIISYFNANLTIENFININLFTLLLFFFLLVTLLFFFHFIKKEKFSSKKILKLSLFDIAIWLLQFLQIIIIIKILEINLNVHEIVFIFGSAIIIGLFPISIGGFGVRDYVIFYLFNNKNVEADIFLVLLLFNLRYILPIIIGFLVSFSEFKHAK